MKDVVAIDLGGTNIRAARVGQDGKIQARDKIETRAAEGFEKVVARMAELVGKVRGPETCGIGLGTPGTPDPVSGVMHSAAVNIPDSAGFPLCPRLTERTGLPAAADNDANLHALGESWQGAGRGEAVVLMLTLGTGIGGGLVIGGQVYHGVSNSTEIGHTCVDVNGRLCACGCIGCFEAHASANAAARDAREAVLAAGKKGKESLLYKKCGGDLEKLDAQVLCDAARDGDTLANLCLDRTCDYLAAGTGSLVNALNPSCVIYGGGLALAGAILFDRVRARLGKNRAYQPIWKVSKLVEAKLGDDAGLIGAARLAFEKAGIKV